MEYNAPAIGRAAVAVLERNGVDVALPDQRCCGMPYLDGGAVEQCRALVRDNVRTLAAAVREGREIVVAGADVQLHAEAGVPVARRLRGRQAGGRAHA